MTNDVALIRRPATSRLRLVAASLLLGSLLTLAIVQPALATHVRPKGATPKFDSLAISYKACGGPTMSHAMPLGYPSCPPAPTSPWLTAGSPDSNGLVANFVGSVKQVLCPPPGGCGAPFPAGEDIKVVTSIVDVRCTAMLAGATPGVCPGGAFAPYVGTVKVIIPELLTDHCNVAGPPPAACPALPGTAGTGPPGAAPPAPLPFPFSIIVGCMPAGAGIGATCALTTTYNALIPGFIVSGYKNNIQMGQVTVQDGGSDGSAATAGTGDATYAESGMFAP